MIGDLESVAEFARRNLEKSAVFELGYKITAPILAVC